ncbi:MAG: hypothetical protein R2798_09085 [Chitinophagales bacterium]
MLHRKLLDVGIPLWAAYAIVPIAFVLLSYYLFFKTEFAAYIYVFTALSFVAELSEPKRNDFLKSMFGSSDYAIVRMLENLFLSFPFLLFLAYKGLFLFVLVLGLLAIFMALFNFNTNTNFTIPTPFGKKPFEFAVGFRKTFFVFPIAYFFTIMSIYAGNFNLGIFSMIFIALICLFYYSNPENKYYIWNFSTTPKMFLFEKIKICFAYFTLLSLPILVLLPIFFFENTLILFGFFFLCQIYLTTIILAKYAAYPYEINFLQGILLAISLMFPPTLIGIIPFFYTKSVKNLKPILND